MEPVLCTVCSSAGSPTNRETGRPNGLPVLYRLNEQEVQVAILGDIRPEFQAGGSWKSRSAVGEGRAQPVYECFTGQELISENQVPGAQPLISRLPVPDQETSMEYGGGKCGGHPSQQPKRTTAMPKIQ